MKTICFSVTCHESIECLFDLIENIIVNSSNYNSYILLSITGSLLVQYHAYPKKYANVIITTVRHDHLQIWGHIELFNTHMLNVNVIPTFDYFWFVSSNEMFIKPITDDHLNKYRIRILDDLDNSIENTYDDVNKNLDFSYWINEFNKDVHTKSIFEKNNITTFICQHEGIVLDYTTINIIKKLYDEYEIYSKSTHRNYVLEEIFIQSVLKSKFKISPFIYFCFRYLTIKGYHIDLNNHNENNENYLNLYNMCYYHPYALSMKPVPRIYNHPLRQIVREKSIKKTLFIMNTGFQYEENKTYFGEGINAKLTINDDIITLNKINSCPCGFVWIGYKLYKKGFYKVSFEMYSDVDINFDFIKLHKPVRFYKIKNIQKNTWVPIDVIIEALYEDDLMVFIFDGFFGYLNVQFRNIKGTQIYDASHNMIRKQICPLLPKVFASGSCRLLNPLGKGLHVIESIHALFDNDLAGINFIGKLHDIQQHIQFVKFIKNYPNDIPPPHILKKFLTSYNVDKWNQIRVFDEINLMPYKMQKIKESFDTCHTYIFEICSIKIYKCGSYYVQKEQYENNVPTDCIEYTQTEDELTNKIMELTNLITKYSIIQSPKIIFQCHIRPNIISPQNAPIKNREIIYDTLIKFSQNNPEKNVYVYDPSIILQRHNECYDGDVHFTKLGSEKSFEYLYDNFIGVTPKNTPKIFRCAICIRGAIGKYHSNFINKNALYENNDYVNIDAVKKSIMTHIIEPNSEYEFDFFVHSWNTDLEQEMMNLYKPVSNSFENNKIYEQKINMKIIDECEYSGVSQMLTIKKSIELKEKYEKENKFKYDVVIVYRPDVLLWKNILLKDYNIDTGRIYVNGHDASNGDFHFIMNYDSANKFKYLYDSVNKNNRYVVHRYIKNYVCCTLGWQLIMDKIIPGVHQEVFRKLKNILICGNVTESILKSYGVTDTDIKQFV